MDGIGGYSGLASPRSTVLLSEKLTKSRWRWIFIIEGLLTVTVAIIFKFWVVDWPETARFLTDADRALHLRRLRSDAGFARMEHLDKRAAKRIFSDWKIYVGIIMYMGVVNTGYATSFFIPTIIEQLGFTAEGSQVRSIPVFMVAAVLSLATAWTADRVKHRYTFTMLGVAVATTGYVILLCQDSVPTGVRYFACFLITGGGFMTQPVTGVWLSNVRFNYHAAKPYRTGADFPRTLPATSKGQLPQPCKSGLETVVVSLPAMSLLHLKLQNSLSGTAYHLECF